MLSGEFNQRINSNPPTGLHARSRSWFARHRNGGDQRVDNSDRENLRKHQIQRSPVHPAQNNIIILIVISLIRCVYAAAHITACLQQLELASFCTLVHIFKRIQLLETCTDIMERRRRIPYNLL